MIEALVTVVGTGLLGVVAWAFVLQSRVSVLEADKVTIRELINVHLGSINTQLHDMKNQIGRIENKLDKESK